VSRHAILHRLERGWSQNAALKKLHERFATAKESLRDASLRLLDADETAHADVLIRFSFQVSFASHDAMPAERSAGDGLEPAA
jgi:hypothetical protein